MAGASREQLEAAEDDDDARGAMIDLVLKYENTSSRIDRTKLWQRVRAACSCRT